VLLYIYLSEQFMMEHQWLRYSFETPLVQSLSIEDRREIREARDILIEIFKTTTEGPYKNKKIAWNTWDIIILVTLHGSLLDTSQIDSIYKKLIEMDESVIGYSSELRIFLDNRLSDFESTIIGRMVTLWSPESE